MTLSLWFDDESKWTAAVCARYGVRPHQCHTYFTPWLTASYICSQLSAMWDFITCAHFGVCTVQLTWPWNSMRANQNINCKCSMCTCSSSGRNKSTQTKTAPSPTTTTTTVSTVRSAPLPLWQPVGDEQKKKYEKTKTKVDAGILYILCSRIVYHFRGIRIGDGELLLLLLLLLLPPKFTCATRIRCISPVARCTTLYFLPFFHLHSITIIRLSFFLHFPCAPTPIARICCQKV